MNWQGPMRIRAGIVLMKEKKVALIERHRAGLNYFVFPGGGVDDGESAEQAAVREAMEELGMKVAIKQKVAEVQMGRKSRQVYFLVEAVSDEFGTGVGTEYTNPDPNDPEEGIYIPIWMPIDELLQHTNVYPANIARLVVQSIEKGWIQKPILTFEESKERSHNA